MFSRCCYRCPAFLVVVFFYRALRGAAWRGVAGAEFRAAAVAAAAAHAAAAEAAAAAKAQREKEEAAAAALAQAEAANKAKAVAAAKAMAKAAAKAAAEDQFVKRAGELKAAVLGRRAASNEVREEIGLLLMMLVIVAMVGVIAIWSSRRSRKE